jgi:hypothetical protein
VQTAVSSAKSTPMLACPLRRIGSFTSVVELAFSVATVGSLIQPGTLVLVTLLHAVE